MTHIIDGQSIAEQIQNELQQQVVLLLPLKPCLTVILIGDDIASSTYVRMKRKACEKVGIISHLIELPKEVSQQKLLDFIQSLNEDTNVHGILVQLPLPEQIDTNLVLESISPQKDVDGVHSVNMGKLLGDRTGGFEPCTPKGVLVLLERSGITTKGKHAVVVGRSNIVGKPLAAMFLRRGKGGDATVTVAHKYTENLAEICRTADILVVAIGQPRFIKAHMIRAGAVVIDVGINALATHEKSGKRVLVGDVDFASVAPICSAITPVPKGVGPMTIAMLLSNTLLSCQRFAGIAI